MNDETHAVQPKPWFQSITIWVNVIAFVLVGLPLFDAYLTDATWLSDETAREIGRASALLVALLNVVLRLFFTKQPISGTPSTEGARRTRTTTEVSGPG